MSELEALPKLKGAEIGQVFREEYGRCVASLIRTFGDIDVAEDAVQDAFAVALREWTSDGLPPNPGGWITTTGRNLAIDRLRREYAGPGTAQRGGLALGQQRSSRHCRGGRTSGG